MMKSIIYVKKIGEEIINNLNIFDYTIMYFDQENHKLKLAIPDYEGEYFDNLSLYSLVNKNIGFFRKINKNMNHKKSIGLLLEDDEIINVFGKTSKEELMESLDINGRVLIKRLK